VPDEGCNQRSSEVIRGVQAACLMRDAIRGHQRSPRSGPSRRAHHDALTTTRFLTFRYGPCSLMRSRALRLNPQWPACLSITRRSRTQSGNLTEPLMRNAVILALSDVGDGLAACALLLHAHEPSLVTDTPPSCVRLGCAHLCPVAVPRSPLGHARRILPLVFAVYVRTTSRCNARLRTVLECNLASLSIIDDRTSVRRARGGATCRGGWCSDET
jgi:hypothetical protein